MLQPNSVKSVLAAFVILTALPGCDTLTGRETAGEYVDDAAITAQVKTAILKDPLLETFQISVKTLQDVVQLSGFVDSKVQALRAGELAAGIKGVKQVKNDLIVRKAVTR